jgi:hypothetical protein
LERQERPLTNLASTSQPTRELQPIGSISGTLNDLLNDSIDETLHNLIGRRGSEAVYDYLERNFAISRDKIPNNLEKFNALLDETFGRGSKTIGKAIVRKLFEKLSWNFVEVPGFEFSDYLEAVRARIARELVQKAKSASRQTISLAGEKDELD